MPIEPFIRCSDVSVSLDFYVGVLDFEVIRPPDPDPAAFMSRYSLVQREGSRVHLSAHPGDGEFGNTIYIRVDDIDPLYESFVANGLATEPDAFNPCLRIAPVCQTWGMKEFTVTDPDGNRITYGHALSE